MMRFREARDNQSPIFPLQVDADLMTSTAEVNNESLREPVAMVVAVIRQKEVK